jgi:hypothetical protein
MASRGRPRAVRTMETDEVARRLRALLALPPKERPISFMRIATVCGYPKQPMFLYNIAKGVKLPGPILTARIARILDLLEAGRLRLVRGPDYRDKWQLEVLEEEEAKAPVAIRRVLLMSKDGPVLRNQLVNPNRFEPPPGLWQRKP